MRVADFVQSLPFQILVLPVILLLIGVFAKRLGKRDGDDSPGLNDWAVSTTVLLMTFSKVSADIPLVSQDLRELTETIFWLFGILFVIFLSIDHDRFRSWVKDATGHPTKDKRLFIGVLWPDVLSILVFSAYQTEKLIK